MSKLKYKHILSFHKKQPVQMYKLFLFKKLRLAMTNRIQYLFLLRLIALYRYFSANARNTTGAELVVDGGNTIQLYPLINQ